METMMSPMQRFPTPPPPSPEPEESTPIPMLPQIHRPQHPVPKRNVVVWAIIIALVSVFIGFFIGKTMTPVNIYFRQ